MPNIRNLALIKRFTEYFKLKTNDMLDTNAGRMLVPVVNLPVPPDIKQIVDVVLNDSDKTLTVPTGKQWKLIYGNMLLIASAQAGNRSIEFSLRDEGGNVLYSIVSLNVQVASTTERYMFGQFADTSESVGTFHLMPIPNSVILPSNFQIRIRDRAGIDPAVDDMTIRLIVEETDLEDI